jgi:peptidoglycan hydrolase CwlO-like protein
MSTTNYPSASPQNQPPKKDSKNLIIGLLAVGILGTWGYFLWDKNKSDQQITSLQTQYVAVDSSKNELQKSFDAAVIRLDSLTGYNNELEGKLSERNSEIQKMKNNIAAKLKKERLTEREKKELASQITELNTKIGNLEAEVARLTQENQVLTTEKTQLTADKEKLTTDLTTTTTAKVELEKKVDVASTLNASNIGITPINEKSGGREKVTTTAKRVDKLVISFDVDNRIAPAGSTDVYVAVTDPEGKPVTVEALGSGTFTTREEGDKFYTFKMPVTIETGKKVHVEYPWKQNSGFKKGNYKIEVYHNGFKIGESVRELKKGGLFS